MVTVKTLVELLKVYRLEMTSAPLMKLGPWKELELQEWKARTTVL
jgi:hypothetical protein